MRINLFFLFFGASIFAQSNNVGINTSSPDASAILEISADPAPNSTVTTKKGLLLPKVALNNNQDINTVPNPAVGLMVYNLAKAGTSPNEVNANTYYYWNGSKWVAVALYSFVEEAVKPRIFSIESSATTSFTLAQVNAAVDPVPRNIVSFTETPIINVANIITYSSANSTFRANFTGLYDISAFVNYNPMNATGNRRAFLNFIVQKSTNNGGSWTDVIGTRTAWGIDGSHYLKTANILSLPIQLNANDLFRFIIANPFITSAGNDHGNDGDPYIGTTDHLPLSKGVTVQLLDYNL